MLHITYDPKKDAKNWIRLAAQYPDEFTLTRYYPFDRTIPVKKENLDRIAGSITHAIVQDFQRQAEVIARAWQSQEHMMVQKIADYLRVSSVSLEAKAALTTAYRMPYDVADRWFMIPTHKPLSQQLRTILHELFHFYHLMKTPEASRSERESAVEQFLKTIPESFST